MSEAQGVPVPIKKYADRLYNTATASYATFGDLAEMLKRRRAFVVTDAKTGEDITRSVLIQMRVEEEQR
jgi:polyhydroxyalkanoate synthesis repressor PhaR